MGFCPSFFFFLKSFFFSDNYILLMYETLIKIFTWNIHGVKKGKMVLLVVKILCGGCSANNIFHNQNVGKSGYFNLK